MMKKCLLLLPSVVLTCRAFSGPVRLNRKSGVSTTAVAVTNIPFFASFYEQPKESGTATVTTRLPLGTIFDSRDYILTCATNMRGYEWTTKEADELLDDLSDASMGKFDSSQDYELNQVVLVPLDWDQQKYGLGNRYDVHDGQQRLVSICLLLASLRESFRSETGMEETVDEIQGMLFPTKVRKEDIRRIELRARDDDILSRILTGAEIDLDAEKKTSGSTANRHVTENYQRLLSRVSQMTKDERLHLLDYMIMHVHMLVCIPDSATIARNIVMSQGKGMDNEPIDDFKGLVCFRYTQKEEDMYSTLDKWDSLASTSNLENNAVGRDVVAAACLLRTSSALRTKIRKNDQIYSMEKWLREVITQHPDWEGKEFFSKEVEEASLVLGNFRAHDAEMGNRNFFARDKNGKLSKSIAMRLNFIRTLTATVGSTKEIEMVVLELLLMAKGKVGKKPISFKNLDKYLCDVERLALWMALSRPSAQLRYNRCFELLDVIQGTTKDEDFIAITQEEQSMLREELVCFEFGQNASGRKIATAILGRLNAHLLHDSKEDPPLSSALHLEHVLPLKGTKKMWGDDWPDQDDRDKWVHRLGNLVLLSNKGSAKDVKMDFNTKKERFMSDSLPLTNNVAKMDAWNKDSMIEHMGSTLNLVEGVFGL